MSTLLFNGALLVAEATLILSLRRHLVRTLAAELVLGVGITAAVAGLALVRFGGESMFGLARLWAWAIFLHGPLLLSFIAWRSGSTNRRLRWVSASSAVVIVAVAADAFLIEPHWIEVSRVTIASAEIEVPTRLVLVADLQADHVGEYERHALELVMAETPDAILFAGDYVHLPEREARVQHEVLAQLLEEVGLEAPLGIYAVGGNTDAPGWERIFNRIEAHTFTEGGRVQAGELVITGLTFPQSFEAGTLVEDAPGFHIVLGHAPDFALREVEADLLLAGHCHGGQVRLPFFGPPVILSRVPRKWTSGAHEISPGKTLVVSRGVGMERARAPRLRFLCSPELVVIDLVPRD